MGYEWLLVLLLVVFWIVAILCLVVITVFIYKTGMDVQKMDGTDDIEAKIMSSEDWRECYFPFKADADYAAKHRPVSWGYYLVYKDGYIGWSSERVL